MADLFAGGGAIPLEGLRLGCETYAIELNPVAHIIELCTLVYPQKYGKNLADEVEKWGNWVIEKVKGEIGDLYPSIYPHPLTPSPRGEEEQDSLSKLAGKQREIPSELLERAKELRKIQTPTEQILWECLRDRRWGGAKFRRQHNIGSYIVDFYCHDARLVVEVDGGIHEHQQERDENRDHWLMQQGFQVVRFKNEEVQETLDLVLTKILDYVNPSQTTKQTSLFPDSAPLAFGRGAGGEGLTPVAYLWTRTVKCPNPSCGASVPLVRQTWLCKKAKKYVALKVIPNHQTKRVDFEVIEATTAKDLGFDPALGSSRGNSTCLHCGTTVNVKYVKEEGKAGRIGQQLMAIVCTTAGTQGKTYLSATDYQRYIPDDSAILQRLEKLCQETGLTIPDEPLPDYGVLGFRVQPYGLVQWSHLFTPRQLLSLMTFVKWVRLAHEEILQDLGVGSSFGAVAQELGKDELKMGDLGKDKNEESNVKGLGENTSQNAGKLPISQSKSFMFNTEEEQKEFAKAICTYLGILCDRLSDYNSSIAHWHSSREVIGNTFARQALPMVWDFTEINPLGNASGNANGALDWITKVINQEAKNPSLQVTFNNKKTNVIARGDNSQLNSDSQQEYPPKQSQDNTDTEEIASLRYRFTRNDSINIANNDKPEIITHNDKPENITHNDSISDADINDNEDKNQPNYGKLYRTSSMALPLETESLDAIITDPPYFDSVPYADLSDFFYVWLKRSIGHLYPEHFSSKLTPKKQEAIMEPSRHGGDKQKAAKAYEEMMHKAFCEANRVLKNNGIIAIVYAHKTTAGWTTLIDSLRRAGFIITEAFPLDTEMAARLRGQNSAALASSIFLIARKRTTSEVGDYAMDVQPLLKEIIQERVKTLMKNEVSGADLVIACVGAGLRAYTQYETVELPNGEELDAKTFLDEVQKEVAETILKEVLGCDQKGVSAVDKPTQYYILGRYEYGEAIVEFDEANTLARGVGVELDGAGGLTDGKVALVSKEKNKVRLKNYQERGKNEDLGILNVEKQQRFNEKPQVLGTPPTLIDILHRLLWLTEHKPVDINNYLALAQPDAAKLRLVAQSLAGRALTPDNSLHLNGNVDEENNHKETSQRSEEQRAIDTLLASWKRTIEDNLFTRGG